MIDAVPAVVALGATKATAGLLLAIVTVMPDGLSPSSTAPIEQHAGLKLLCSPAPTVNGKPWTVMSGVLTSTPTDAAVVAEKPVIVELTVVTPGASGSKLTPPPARVEGESKLPAAIVTVWL